MASNDTLLSSGSVFWISAYLISFVGLILLGIWGFFNNSIRATIIAFIFFAMLASSAILSKEVLFSKSKWSTSATAFTIGFVLWLIVGSSEGTFSLLSVSQSGLFAVISSELPEFIEFVFNVFVIPIAEESLWIIAIPDVLSFIFDKIGAGTKRLGFFKNKFFQLIGIIAIGSLTFAYFHIGNIALTSFIIAAMIFRTIMIIFVVGDSKLDILPSVTVVPAFAVGAHIGHNLGDFGLSRGINLLLQSPPIGWIIIAFFAIIFFTFIETSLGWVNKTLGGSSA